MPQLVLTERHFIDDKTLQIFLPSKLYLSPSEYNVGACWASVTFIEGGSRKILIGSDCVQGQQSLRNTQLIGSFNNTNNEKHFFCESNFPQVFGKLNKGSALRVQLFDEDTNPICYWRVNHLAVCVVLIKTKMKENNYMLSLSGEVNNNGSDGNVMSYICTVNIPRGIRIKPSSTAAVTDIFLPKLTHTEEDGRIRDVIGDHDGGLLHVSIFSDIVSYDSDINSQLLRSFCVRAGQRNYTPPFLLHTLLSPGEHRNISFTMKVHTCADLLKLKFRGNLEVNLVISE